MSKFKAAVLSRVLVKPLKVAPIVCKIVLEGKNTEIYHPGRELIGHVDVKYNDEFQFCGLKLVIEGLIHIKYREKNIPFEKKDSIWTESVYLTGAYGTHKIRSTPHSESVYSFSFQIPGDIPGSYQSDYGTINYHIYVLADYGDGKFIKRADRKIVLEGQLDLDPDDLATASSVTIEARDEKAVKQVAHNRKSTDMQLKFSFRIEESGFICGEHIPFTFEYENPRRSYKVKLLKVQFIQATTYHGGKYVKRFVKELNSVTFSKESVSKSSPNVNPISYELLEKPRENYWEGKIEIPRKLIPSRKGEIEIEYFLRATIETDKIRLTEKCFVTIGTSREGLSIEDVEEASKFYGTEEDPEERARAIFNKDIDQP